MKRIGFVVIILLVGILIGYYYGTYIKSDPLVVTSLHNRTITYLEDRGYTKEEYTLVVKRNIKFPGNNYEVIVQFKDEPGRSYILRENNNGNIIFDGSNGTKHSNLSVQSSK